MALILFNKPFQVMCQFSPHPDRETLAQYIQRPGFYPAGRLDADSEGLVLLTDDGILQNRISHPDHKQAKIYLVQVDGILNQATLQRLREPLDLGDFVTQSCEAAQVVAPTWLWPRDPPIRTRATAPTSWLKIILKQGKNRQVRRMTAKIGCPTLRLIRIAIGPYSLVDNPLWPGDCREVNPALMNR
jgi:23S rRNA pseudouridine2457 synthase